MAPEASPERSCSLHTCPLEDPTGEAVSAPTVSTLQAVDPTSPLTAGHFAFPRAPQDYQEGSSLLGLGDQASLCAHVSNLSTAIDPAQHDGVWKPPSVQRHVVSVRYGGAGRASLLPLKHTADADGSLQIPLSGGVLDVSCL